MEKEAKKKKATVCFRCKKKIAGKPKNISFIHEGLRFVIFKNGMECTKCAKKKFVEEFEKNGRQLISLKKGKIKINWPMYSQACKENSASKMSDILISLGIFSLNSRGNWEIIADGGISLNPRSRLSSLYFSREKDAVEFARLNYSDTLYSWEIRHIDKVLSKE